MAGYRSLGYEIATAHKALRAKFQELLAPHDITVQQFEVMRRLKTAPGITAAQLAERILSDSSTMMSILKRLETKGLILRNTDEKDRRIKQIRLTETGETLTGELTVIADRHHKRMLDCCSSKELQIFYRVLSKLRAFSQAN